MKPASTIKTLPLLPVLFGLLATAPLARSEGTNAPFSYLALLDDVSVYLDTNDLQAVRSVFTNIIAGQKPTPVFVNTLGDVFKRYRLHNQSIATMRYLAPFSTGGTLAAARREEARALFRKGAFEEAVELLVSISNLTGTISNEDRHEAAAMGIAAKALGSIVLQDAFDLRDSLDACLRNASKGPATAVKLLQSQGDQVVLDGNGHWMDATEFIRREAAGGSKEFRDAFQQLLEAEAAQVRQTLSGADARKHAQFWKLYRGTRGATEAMEQFAWRLVNHGRPELASLWFAYLRQDPRSAVQDARYAYARSLVEPPLPSKALLERMTAAERKAVIQAGNRSLPLEEFIASLPDAPPEPSGMPTPRGLKLSAGWMAPVFPAEGLSVNASHHYSYRDRFIPAVIQPSPLDNDVIFNTGLSMRRYAADSGSNVWTTPYQPKVVDDRPEANAFTQLPNLPVPVFGALVQGDVIVGRYADQINQTRALIVSGMAAVDARTGALRWWSRDIPELAGVHVVSEPGAVRGVVCFLTADFSSGEPICRAVAIEARTGAVLWNRVLHIGGDSYGGTWGYSTLLGRELPRPLPTARGFFVATQRGYSFLLDTLTGSVVWMRSYARMPLDNRPYGLVTPPLAAGGAIVMAPIDSANILALDPATGKTLWEKPAALEPFLGGVWQDKIVVFGRGIRLLDAASGATVAAASMDWKPSAPLGIVTGNRFWITDETETRLFDLPTLKQADAVSRGGRLLPVGSMAFSTLPNVIAAVRPGAAAATPATPAPVPGRTVRLRNATPGKPPEWREPAGDISPCLLWEVASPGNFSLPDEDRGVVLLHGFQDAKLINANGFGEPYWEIQTTSIIRRVIWTDETVALQTDSDLLGVDIATGSERWRLPIRKEIFTSQYSKGDLFVTGLSNNTEVLRINPRDGAVRWRTATPSNQLAQAIRETAGRVHVELRPTSNINAAWYIRELGDDGKFGREMGGNPNFWKDKIAFLDLGPDRVYTVGEGQVYRCWDPALKQMLWPKPFVVEKTWVTEKKTVPGTPGTRPWWHLTTYNGPYSVLDTASGQSLYSGNGRPWNSDILDVGWENSRHTLTRWKLQGGKAADKRWKISFGEQLRSVYWPESGAGLWLVYITQTDGEMPTWFLQLDPETGKTVKKIHILPPRLLTSHVSTERVIWKYGNRLTFLATQQKLYCVTMVPAAGAPAWHAERRQAALRIASPAERARALQIANLSEQLGRQAESEWVASRGPLVLDQPWHWIPAAEFPLPRVKDWAGPSDLSATVAAELKPGPVLTLTVDVRDDTWEPFNGVSGDAIMIAGQMVLGLDTRCLSVLMSPKLPKEMAPTRATVEQTGPNLLRYTVELPPKWHNPYASNPSNTVYNGLNLTIHDDDGQGGKGFMQWGRCTGQGTIRFQK